MNSIKLIVVGVITLTMVLGISHIVATFEERDKLKTELHDAKKEIDNLDSTIAQLHDDAIAEAKRIETYVHKFEEMKDETNKLNACIADKSCGFTIRVRTITVKEPNNTSKESDSAPTTDETARLAPESERAYFRHRDAIDLVKANFDLCLTTLKEWQNDERCKK